MKEKRGTIKLSLIISYMMVALILIILNLVLYTVCENVLNKQIEVYNEFAAETVSGHIKDITVDIQDLYHAITLLPNSDRFLSAKNINDYFSDAETAAFLSAFRQKAAEKKDSIDFMYIYVEKLGCVVLETGILDEKVFFTNYIGGNDSFEGWKKSILEKTTYYETVLKNVTIQRDAVAYNIPFERKSGVILCTAVEKENFFGKTESVQWLKESNMLIYDRYGKLLAAKNSAGAVPQSIKDIEKSISNETLVFQNLVKVNTVSLWTVLLAPKKLAIGSMLMVRRIFYGINIVALILVIIIISYYFRKNFKPIKELATVLNMDSENLNFAKLKDIITKKIDENNIYLKRMESQEAKMRLVELERMLRGGYATESKERRSKQTEFDFSASEFSIILFSYNDIEGFFSEYSEMTEEEKFRLLLLVTGNIFEELLNTDKTKAYVLDVDNEIICVVNHSGAETAFLTEKLNYGTEVIANEYNFDISYVMSQARSGQNSISQSYAEVEKMNEYKLLLRIDGNIYCPQPIVSSAKELKYYFDAEVEKALTNYILSGNYDMAKSVIISCFESIKAERVSIGGYVQCMVYDIMAAIVKAALTAGVAIGRGGIEKIFEVSFSREDIYTICNQVLKRLKLICRSISSDADKKKIDISERIREYVRSNYPDINMSMTYIGEYFDMAPSYLSKKFKDEYGESLPDYIIKLRLEKAKKLMCIEDHTLSAIAEMSGFSNVRTFNRVFKKYEGTTPSEYRNRSKE